MMNIEKKIHQNVVGSFYVHLLLCMVLICLNFLFEFANFIAVASIFAFAALFLIINRKISPDNLGTIAVVQMTAIVGMIGCYDYFSTGHDRLNFFLSLALGSSSAFSCYGFYFRVREKR